MAAALAREATEQSWSRGHKGREKNPDGSGMGGRNLPQTTSPAAYKMSRQAERIVNREDENVGSPNEVKAHENLAPQLLSEHASTQDLIIQ
jgi:hypothetical protein